MNSRLIKAVQLLAVAPVAVTSLIGVFLGVMAIASVFATGNLLGSLAIGLALSAPAFMVLALGFAIVFPPEVLRTRDRLAGGVALGLVSGSILAAVLIYMELTSGAPAEWTALLTFGLPLALAIVHTVRIARAKPAVPDAAPPLPPPPVE